MGLLDQVIGSVVGQVLGGGRGGHPQAQAGGAGGGLAGGIGGALSNPIVKAMLMLLLAKAASGGLGNVFGGGQPAPDSRGRLPGPGDDDGDLGGFGQGRGDDGGYGGGYDAPRGGPRGDGGGNDGGAFSDLSGMLDGPGDRSPGRGPYAHLDEEPRGGGPIGGGLDGLIQSFERGGLGDVIGSWIGPGGNQPIPPNRLADALGEDTVDTLSRQTGLDRNDLLQQLAVALPSVVDQLTPHGRPPNEDERRAW